MNFRSCIAKTGDNPWQRRKQGLSYMRAKVAREEKNKSGKALAQVQTSKCYVSADDCWQLGKVDTKKKSEEEKSLSTDQVRVQACTGIYMVMVYLTAQRVHAIACRRRKRMRASFSTRLSRPMRT